MQKQDKILAVDDNTTNLAIIDELLDSEDYCLKAVTTGAEALEFAQDFQPDLILLDIMMPDMDGYEVCRRLRANPNLGYVKIIMVSAKGSTVERLEGYAAGADDYIVKPFDHNEFRAKVRVYLHLKHINEIEQMRQDFTVKVTHEIRTPMAIVKGIISNAVANVYGKMNPKLRQQLEIADQNIGRLTSIVSDFFDISKIEAGRMEFQPTRCEIRSVVTEVVDSLKTQGASKKIRLSAEMPCEELLIHADRQMLIKILTQLIMNSIKFIHDGGHINVKVKNLTHTIGIDVEDDGPGIRNNEIDEIFDRFVQLENHVGPGIHGTGLGLAVAKGLVEQHEGRIWAENRPEGGAVFSFEIPMSCQSDGTPEAAEVPVEVGV